MCLVAPDFLHVLAARLLAPPLLALELICAELEAAPEANVALKREGLLLLSLRRLLPEMRDRRADPVSQKWVREVARVVEHVRRKVDPCKTLWRASLGVQVLRDLQCHIFIVSPVQEQAGHGCRAVAHDSR